MSKIALTPNASGTGVFTIASPATNTDRTLTLPDEAGSIVVNTATGIDVTGTVVADGLTVDGGADASTSYTRFTENLSGYGFNGAYASYKGSSNELILGRHNTFDSLTANDIPVMSIARATGDISFYEDTGTTAKFFWDASAENLYLANINPVLSGVSTGVVSATSFTVGGQTSGADSMYIRRAAAAEYQLQTTNGGASGGEIHLQPYGGNVGIGTTSPDAKLQVGWGSDQLQFTNPSAGKKRIGASYTGYVSGNIHASMDLQSAGSSGGDISFNTMPSGGSLTERMRIFSDGRVTMSADGDPLTLTCTGATGSTTKTALGFKNGSNGYAGAITISGTATNYSSFSDYRLKTDAQPMVGASDRVLALKPVNFEWISSGDRVDGFLAHEAQEVVPEAVTGTKDAMRDEEYEVTAAVEATYDEDGNELTAAVEAVMGTRSVPDYQGIDQSKLVPLLTAALQEALTEISALKVRVAALEAV